MNKTIKSAAKNTKNHFFKDTKDNVVITQTPNLPLLSFGFSKALELITMGDLQQIAAAVAFGSFFAWAWMELFQGVNYFRRIIGLVALVVVVANRVY